MEENVKEFIAFSKKLLRVLIRLKVLLEDNKVDEAKVLLDELIEDTKSDIEP